MYHECAKPGFQSNGKCPVCDSDAHIGDVQMAGPCVPHVVTPFTDSDCTYMAVCRICGRFRFGDLGKAVLEGLRNKSGNRLYRASHVLRTNADRLDEIVDSRKRADGTYGSSSLYSVQFYSRSDFEKMLDGPDPSVQEKLDLLLKHLAGLSAFPGDQCRFDNANDYSVLCAKNSREADFYIESLRDHGFLTGEVVRQYDGGPSICTNFTLSTKGWTELDRISKSGGESPKAFVAMWFDPSRNPFYDAMEEAIRSAGYDPIRIDRVEHINSITDEIISQIRQSKFLVSDFTGQRNGVYFEAGFMLGLGRPVIWACEKGDLDNVHFDARQYNTIDYADADDLRKRLQFRIGAILGQGPKKTK